MENWLSSHVWVILVFSLRFGFVGQHRVKTIWKLGKDTEGIRVYNKGMHYKKNFVAIVGCQKSNNVKYYLKKKPL